MVLVKSREQVADELRRLQRDNESLQGKHKLHVELQQQEGFQMPDNVQVGDFRFLLQGKKTIVNILTCLQNSDLLCDYLISVCLFFSPLMHIQL